MDTELARTFVEIVASGSFGRAARRLNVSQTAVSARIRALEDRLGQRLFVRNKAGASLTPAGERFLRYAPSLLQLWRRALHQVAVPPGHRAVLAIGGELSLWDPLLLRWLVWMRRSLPDIALRAQVGLADDLLRQVVEGVLDLAVMYAPRLRSGLEVEALFEETLVLVTTSREPPAPGAAGLPPDYVQVDWGPDFALHHGMSQPEADDPGLFVGLGPLALSYILEAGGSGYFRRRAVRPHLDAGRLHLVPGAAEFTYPAYAVYGAGADRATLEPALAGLRAVAEQEAGAPMPSRAE